MDLILEGLAELCPEWNTLPSGTKIGEGCQQAVSSCLLSRVNQRGLHVPLSLRGDDSVAGDLMKVGTFFSAYDWKADRTMTVKTKSGMQSYAYLWIMPADVSGLLVPNMLVQPLLENAVRHGVARHARPGVIHLRIRRQGGELVIAVRDSGTGFGPETPDGTGLRITRERLASLYGPGERLSFSTDENGFEVRVTLPCREAGR